MIAIIMIDDAFGPPTGTAKVQPPPSFAMSAALQMPVKAEMIRLPQSCGNLASHMSRKSYPGDPGELRSYPQSYPNVVEKLLRKPRRGQDWPKLAKFGKGRRTLAEVGGVWSMFANFGPTLVNIN